MATQSFTSSSSSTRTRTLTYTLPGLKGTPTASVNTGSVTITKVEGETVTVQVSGGSGSRVQTGGSYTSAQTKTVTESMSLHPGETIYTYYYDEGGFSGDLTYTGMTVELSNGQTVSKNSSQMLCPFSQTVNGVSYNTERCYQNFSGTVTKPASDTRTYETRYQYTVTFTYPTNSVPTVPSSLVASGSFKPGTNVTLFSGTSTDNDGETVYYQYQYTADGGSSWSTISTVASYSITFAIPSTITGANIQFRVRTYDQNEYSAFRTSPEYAIKYNNAPSAPTAVYITGNPEFLTKGTTYTLNFTGATDVDGDSLTYEVGYRYLKNALVNVPIATNHKENSIQFTVPTDLDIASISFYVRAMDSSNVYSTEKTSTGYRLNNATTVTLNTPINQLVVNEGDSITITGTAHDVDRNQAIIVYYTIARSGERILTTFTSGTETPFEKTLTFKGNALYDGEELLESNVISGTQGDVTLTVYAKDSTGNISKTVTRTLELRPNQAPTLTIDSNYFLTEEGSWGTFVVSYTDNEASSNVYLNVGVRGSGVTKKIDLGGYVSPGEEVGQYFEITQNNSTISLTDRMGETYVVSNKLSTGTYYLDFEVVDGHGTVSETVVVTLDVTANRKPTIILDEHPKVLNSSLGKYKFTGTINDLDGDKLTVNVRIMSLNGMTKPVTVKSNKTFEFEYDFTASNYTNHTLAFIVSDSKDSASVTAQFEVVDDEILFEFKNPIETDLEAQRASLILGHYKTDDAVLTVLICNNGFDDEPTWEDCTQSVINNTPYIFTNNDKTADKWGINMRVSLVKNNAPQIYVDRIGILFE